MWPTRSLQEILPKEVFWRSTLTSRKVVWQLDESPPCKNQMQVGVRWLRSELEDMSEQEYGANDRTFGFSRGEFLGNDRGQFHNHLVTVEVIVG